jgi:hypothetical protein
MKKIFISIVSILLFSVTSQAQFSEMMNKSQVHGSFEADGMYYHQDNAMGITDSLINGRNFAFNGFARVTYSLGNFSAGFRYEAYLPPIAGFDTRLDGNGFPNLWASYATEKFSFTVGSFYEQFGNGLTLRSYEEWTLGYDNAINGVKVQYEPVRGLILKGVYGVQRFFWNKYSNNNRGIVKGADLELSFNDLFAAMQHSKVRLTLGGSAVSKYQTDNDPIYKLPRNVGNFAGRFNLGIGKFNFSSEYAYKINDPSAINNYIYKTGESFLFTASYSRKGLGIFAMFKRTDNFSFKSDRGEIENALDINFLPPIIEPHTYMLASMYPYGTQPNGEIGFQFQVDYKIPKKSALGGKYGTGIHVNYSQINDIVREQVNDTIPIGKNGTLGYTSPFFQFGEKVFYRDLTVEINKKFSKKFKSIFKYIYQEFDIATIQGETGEPVISSHIAIVDMTYKFTSKKALRWEVQGLFTKEDKQSWVAALLEYTISPHWFFTVSDQWNYNNDDVAQRLHYYTAAFGYTLKTTRFAVTYGRQREGVVCVGGVCRQVPASSGFYVTISSSF